MAALSARELFQTSPLERLALTLGLVVRRPAALWASYLSGIGTFIYGFWRWTEPTLFGGSVYWP